MRILALATLGCAAPAMAQPEVLGTWLWEVTTQDGDALVEPGETATFTLSMDFSPDVGEMGLTGEVQGLAAVEFDTLGMLGAELGQILGWEVLNDLDLAKGDVTTTDGISLFGTIAEQPIPFLVLPDDPIEVIRVEWSPSEYMSFDVLYNTNTHLLSVFEGDADNLQASEWPVKEAEIAFQVVPVPYTGLLVAMVASPFLTRRSRCDPSQLG